jgi:hypothetical protein
MQRQKWEYATLSIFPRAEAEEGQQATDAEVIIVEGTSQPRSYKPTEPGQARKHLASMGEAGWEAFSFTVLYPNATMVYALKRPLP